MPLSSPRTTFPKHIPERTRMLRIALASLALCAAAHAAEPEPTPQPATELALPTPDPIRVGVNAPALQNVAWLKGEPITEWAQGHVYLLDFWAPWCQPCIRLMPHNVELAKKHEGKLTVVAVAVWPQPDSETPDAYVARVGDAMPFTVAEDATGHINQTWLEPLAVQGIPHVVLIDQNGRLAWSGHPMDGMDKALDAILDGSYDTDAAAAKAKAEADLHARALPLMQQANAHAEAGEWNEALALVDQLIEMGYEQLNMTLTRFQVMVGQLNDAPAAYAFLDKTAFGPLNDNADALSQIAWFLADAPNLPDRDLDLAQRIAERANSLKEGKEPIAIFTLGRVAAAKNQRDEAISRYEQAIALADGDMKAQMQSVLDEYRQESAPPGPAPEPATEPTPAPEPASDPH